MKFSPSFDLQKEYEKYKNILQNAEQGKVVTRFPPEPSGYLHIGHVKASMINFHYSKIYGGKMIFRFDDTNPSKEKCEFVEAIAQDLKSLGIEWDFHSNTSDYFDKYIQIAEQMTLDGLAYCDNSPQQEISDLREKNLPSKYRDTDPKTNLDIFKQMQNAKKGSKEAEFCLRAKIDYASKNGTMKDPVIFRCNFDPHHKTGTKYVVYPTYDFACPIVDSLEGVTHAMRSNEYHDRNEMYQWFIKNLKLRQVNIWEFSRLNMKSTLMSKRKLQWFVDTGRVTGWDDPRMPTVRGILRRGLRIETLTQFFLEQGPSTKTNLQEWDKIWSKNKEIIDPISPRFQSVKLENICQIHLANIPAGIHFHMIEVNPLRGKGEHMGKRECYYSQNVYIDVDDAVTIKVGEKITLMRMGNVLIKSVKENNGSYYFEADYLPDDTDFKKTQKISYVDKETSNVIFNSIELDHLINVDKLEEEEDVQTVANPNSWFETKLITESAASKLKPNDTIQLERRGYYRIDKVYEKDGQTFIDAFFTPDGKECGLSDNIKSKVDQGQTIKGKKREKDLPHKPPKDNSGLPSKPKPGKPQAFNEQVIPTQEQSISHLNQVLSDQLFLSGTHQPNDKDFEVFQTLKQSNWNPDSKYSALFAWYGQMNLFKQSHKQ